MRQRLRTAKHIARFVGRPVARVSRERTQLTRQLCETPHIPDKRKHRGKHPADDELFASHWLGALREATFELSWLQNRGYSHNAALATVGDRHGLQKRQRRAVMRAACGDSSLAQRAERRVELSDLAGHDIAVDGFNAIITIEAALSGGLVLVARDGCHRDIASVHGSYRKVEETQRACELIGECLAAAGVRSVRIFLDRPVSNSGRLRALLDERAAERAWPWTVELVNNPDRTLVEGGPWVIASNDGWVTERSVHWFDLPGAVIARDVPNAWIVDLRRPTVGGVVGASG